MSTSEHHRVLVAGAGGYLGSSVARAFSRAGWSVRGLVRRPEQRAELGIEGADAVVGDVLDASILDHACRGCSAVVHLAAADPSAEGGLAYSERVRVEGARNLARAARRAGVRRLVVGSGYWVYADLPGTITESSPVDPRGESMVNWKTEQAASEPDARGSLEVIIVRPGMVYGSGSWFRSVFDAIQQETYAYVGDGSNPWSFVAREDAGRGFVAVTEHGAPGEVYNIVDGRPAPWKDFGDFVADRLGRTRPTTMDVATAVRAFGPDIAYHLKARRACSAHKMLQLGWKPLYPSFRDGVSQLLVELMARAP